MLLDLCLVRKINLSLLSANFKMLYWIIYDISSDKIRNRIGAICKNYGMMRAQKSAFIGELSKNKAEMIELEIKNLTPSESDCIFIIPSCCSCFSGKEIIGKLDEERIKDRDFVIIGNGKAE